MTSRLPADVPPAANLLDLLHRECRALLVLRGAPRPALPAVIDAVMRSTTNTRVPLESSTRADHVTTWIDTHRGALLGSVAAVVADGKHDLAVGIIARLLLLAPTGVAGDWVDGLVRLAGGDVADARRAVLWELGARCHIAAGRLTEADGLHALQQEYLHSRALALSTWPAGPELWWRRARLHWSRGDLARALHWLHVITALMRRRPDPEQAQLCGIAHGELLFALGRHPEAVTVIERAVALGPHPATVLARVDADLTLGHALHRRAGYRAAARRWGRARAVLLQVLDTAPNDEVDTATRDALYARLGHLHDLLSPFGPPGRRLDFTVLGPPAAPGLPATAGRPPTPQPDPTGGDAP